MIGRLLDAEAPATRLAGFRIYAGVFVTIYVIGRSPVFIALGGRRGSDFDGVGILAPFSGPPPAAAITALVAIAIASGVATTLGWRYRSSVVACFLSMLALTTLRSSWGQLLHFENLMVLQLTVLTIAPAADAWSLDARRRDRDPNTAGSTRYGWPLALAGLVTVVTYVITGVAKLRYGGLGWMSGDTLQNHIAYSAARLDLLGGNQPVLAEIAVRNEWALGIGAVAAVVIELSAPVVFVGTKARNVWVGAAWLMHVGILLTMAIGFPSPLFGAAFAPFFALESIVERATPLTGRRWWPEITTTADPTP